MLSKDAGKLDFGEPNPFSSSADAGMLASCAYKYAAEKDKMVWTGRVLGDNLGNETSFLA